MGGRQAIASRLGRRMPYEHVFESGSELENCGRAGSPNPFESLSVQMLKENSIAESKIGRQEMWRESKGCDIGYALAVSSCEQAHSVDACTVTALDARSLLSQFQTPTAPRKSQSVCSGPVAHPVALLSGSPSLLQIGNVLFSPTLSAIDGCHPKQLLRGCQCRFSVQTLKIRKPSGCEAKPLDC
jgi:hypothetical protein